jgi:hypothetical protein
MTEIMSVPQLNMRVSWLTASRLLLEPGRVREGSAQGPGTGELASLLIAPPG